jgi:hypothetical protein
LGATTAWPWTALVVPVLLLPLRRRRAARPNRQVPLT